MTLSFRVVNGGKEQGINLNSPLLICDWWKRVGRGFFLPFRKTVEDLQLSWMMGSVTRLFGLRDFI